jgi:hypothetical protein
MTPASDRRRSVAMPLTPVKTGISRSLADGNSGSQPRPQAHIGTATLGPGHANRQSAPPVKAEGRRLDLRLTAQSYLTHRINLGLSGSIGRFGLESAQ